MKIFKCIVIALVLTMCLGITVFASSSDITIGDKTYPLEYEISSNTYNFIDKYKENKETYPNYTVLFAKLGATYAYIFPKGLYVKDNVVYINESQSADRFILQNGAWVHEGKITFSANEYFIPIDNGDGQTKVLMSSNNLKDSSGNTVFERHELFQPALPEVILEVTEGQLKMELPKLVGTIRILILCGVGCLASLVVLKISSPKLLMFHK